MKRLVHRLKRLIRPIVPDRIMARLRLRQQSRHSRNNVLVLVTNGKEARRWAAVTPDTYQVAIASTGALVRPYFVVTDDSAHLQPASAEIVVAGEATAVGQYGSQVVAALTEFGLDATVVARTPPPALWGRRRTEPDIEPIVIATWGNVWHEAGGWPPLQPAAPILADRLTAAGRRLGLVPVVGDHRPRGRTDPINGPVVVIFAAVPLHDVGGGSRGAQMAQELLRRGYHVVYVNVFESTESVDLGLRFLHPQLEQLPLARFDAGTLAARSLEDPRLAIVELPFGQLLAPLAGLGSAGFHTVYDLIDDWSARSLGGDWFKPAEELALIGAAGSLVATAPDLARRLGERSGREVTLVPNGVSTVVFGGEPGPRPQDFPAGGGSVIGYHGSLYGDWFDWRALARVAMTFPEARVLVLGDDRGHPPLPANVHFLGLKAQSELLAYVARFDVGIIPFVVSDVTHAVSPLKAYEYLAAGISVAAPPLRSLEGLDGVFSAPDLADAVREALESAPPDRGVALSQHSWSERLERLFAAAGLELAPISAPEVVVKRRPAVHHPRQLRVF